MNEMQDSHCFFHRFIQLLPLGCACYRVIRDEKGEVEDFVVHACNEAYLAINGVEKAQIVGKRVSEAFPRLAPKALAQLKRLGAQLCSGEHERLDRFMSAYDHTYRVSAFLADPALLFMIYEDAQPQLLQECYANSVPCTFSGLPASERSPKILETFHADEQNDAAFRDSLTGLYDRRYAVRAFELLNTKDNLPLSIILGDVNGLKLTNDVLGYRVGDEVLIKIAKIFRSNCRATDLIARWSGDEFLAILPGTSREEARDLSHRLQRAFKEACESVAHISVALGYATRENEAFTDELFQEAEMCILRTKLLMGQSHRNSTINLLLSILYEKSAETQEHSERMANHCHKIATSLKLSDEQINSLILLAMLHDIGKVGINSEILRKPGALTEEEQCEIRLHPEIGHRITKSIPELSQVSEYILAHHEWWNGQGYPKGLRGKQIPIPSRIIAVVDAYDVMISGRNYRPARSQEEVIAELKRCAGTQFDPIIVDVFVNLLREEM